jgi:transmembrane sensor
MTIMKHKNKSDLDLIISVIEKRANPYQLNIFNEWLEQSPDNLKEYESLKLIWEKTGYVKTVNLPSPDLMWNNIDREINKPAIKINESFDYSYLIKIAAAILVVVTGVIFYLQVMQNSANGTREKEISEIYPESVAYYKLIAHNGEKITCVLPDSSVVHLNSESRLDYPEYFPGNIRMVTLTGEGYFVVKHDINRPFIVKTGNSQVTVTGTEFNVRSRNNGTKIVVAKGSVNVLSLNTRKQENLKKGEMVQLDKSGNITQPIHVNLKYYLAWRENKLAFKHTPLNEVMAEIERTYNVHTIFLNDSARSRTITGIFETDSLEKVLSVLSLTLDLNISQKGMKIIIQ